MTAKATRTLETNVGRLLRSSQFRACLRARTPSGERPIVLAEPEEQFSAILRRLAAYDGYGNIVYQSKGGIEVLALWPAEVVANADVQPVGMRASLAMVLAVMKQSDEPMLLMKLVSTAEYLSGLRSARPAYC
jgi:hypothetical protein